MKRLYNTVVLFFATGMFVGFVPFAPGTFGSVLGAVLAYGAARWLGVYQSLALLAGLLFVGTYVAGVAEKILGQQDSSRIVIDEIAGMYMVMLFLHPGPAALLIAFLCFRAFDILKPFPASYVDKNVHGGIGVMLDDVVAAVYASIAARILIFFYLTV